MFYENSSVSINPSSANTWTNDFLGVYHFNNSVLDGTANNNNLTDNSATNLTSSKIGEGRDLNNSTNLASSSSSGQHLVISNNTFSGVTDFTFSGWMFLDRDNTSWERIFDFGQNTSIIFFFTPSNNLISPVQTRARITTSGSVAE